MKIAILLDDFLWGGGIDLLQLIIKALAHPGEDELEILFLLKGPSLQQRLKSVLARIRVRHRRKKDKKLDLEPILSNFKAIYPRCTLDYYRPSATGFYDKLKESRVDLAMPMLKSLGRNFPIPWIAYIYDFQHRYLSQYFSKAEINKRDAQFAQLVNDAPMVMVNAKAVAGDIRKFYPNHHCLIKALPYSPLLKKEWFVNEEKTVLKRYQITKQYFMISNQFWMHKCYETALQALSILHNQHQLQDIGLVCTGITEDSRDPGYFSKLLELIKKLNIVKQVFILGYIPKEDQIGLMLDALAVIQPTSFEGGPGGGSVYDAVSLGKLAIVSDIPVNREIDAEVLFFKLQDPEDLAQKMSSTLANPSQPVELAVLEQLSQKRLKNLSEHVKYMISETIDKHSRDI